MIKGFNHNRMALFKLFILIGKFFFKKAHRTLHIQHKCFILVQCEILYTSNLYKVLLHLQIQQIKCSSIGAFLWQKCVLRPLLVRKREEKGVSYRLQHVSSARKRRSNTNLSPPWPPPLRLHLFPLGCQSATVLASTDHPVAVLDWPLQNEPQQSFKSSLKRQEKNNIYTHSLILIHWWGFHNYMASVWPR